MAPLQKDARASKAIDEELNVGETCHLISVSGDL
jgi:hypothetical protein